MKPPFWNTVTTMLRTSLIFPLNATLLISPTVDAQPRELKKGTRIEQIAHMIIQLIDLKFRTPRTKERLLTLTSEDDACLI